MIESLSVEEHNNMWSRQAVKGFALVCIISAVISKWLLLAVILIHLIFYALEKIELWKMSKAYDPKPRKKNKM